MKKQKKEQKTNIEIKRANYRERFEIISNYHLLDKRLSLAEKGFYTCLLILPNKWKITQRATAEYLKIDKMTFNRYIKKLIEIGYIDIEKEKNNITNYILKERPINADFNIKEIDNYTIKQLNTFLNDDRIEQRYKELIKKALGTADKTSEQFKQMLEEIEQQEPSEEENNNKLPF